MPQLRGGVAICLLNVLVIFKPAVGIGVRRFANFLQFIGIERKPNVANTMDFFNCLPEQMNSAAGHFDFIPSLKARAHKSLCYFAHQFAVVVLWINQEYLILLHVLLHQKAPRGRCVSLAAGLACSLASSA